MRCARQIGCPVITKSPNDPRNYKHLRLANQLSVLLIQDTRSSKAAASLAVNSGHFDDPLNCQGLAHFLEHMLFLGTEAFPEAEAYQQFISKHGGHHNAWTGSEFTNFYFDIHYSELESALHQFSRFFVCPLFNPDYIEKERQAIESEFKLKQKDDLRRLYQVHKETCNPDHPFSRFSVGNLTTLVDTQDKTLKQQLHEFFDAHYHASRMTLVVSSPFEVDQLEGLVSHLFSDIQNDCDSKPKLDAQLYLPENLGIRLDVQTLRETHRLILSFALPQIYQQYKDKSISYLSFLIGHEAQGSLLALLKRQGLVMGLSAGGGIDGSNYKDFNISLQLTELGSQQIDTVTLIVFSYLNFIRSKPTQHHLYEEKRRLAELAFKYQESGKPIDLVSGLAMNLHQYDAEDVLTGDYLMGGLDISWLDQAFSLLTPDNMRMIVLSKDGEYNKICKWYDAAYKTTQLNTEYVSQLVNAVNQLDFSLPTPNPFVPERMDVLPSIHKEDEPIKLCDEDGLIFWFKQDQTFRVPKGHIYLSLDIPNSQGSIHKVALTRLFIELFLDSVIEENYPAESAGIHYHVYPHQAGMTIHISGFSDKQVLLVHQLIEQLGLRRFDENRFEIVRAQVMRSWRNANKGKPVSKLFSVLNSMLQNNHFQPILMADELERTNFAEFAEFVANLFDRIHVEALVHGDWHKEVAQTIVGEIREHLFDHCNPTREVNRRVFKLPNKASWMPVETQHHDSSILVYYQSETACERDIALYTMANHVLSPVFFHLLRTEKQLGYMLGTGYMPINQCPGFIAYIQSNSHEPVHLLQEIDEFLQEAPEQIEEMDEEHWQSVQEGLIHQITEKDHSLRIRAQRYWLAIGLKDCTFKRRERVAKEISELTQQQLADFVKNRLGVSSDHARVVLSGVGKEHEHKPFGDNLETLESTQSFQHEADLIKLS